jgi:hypothetical protein
MFSIARLYNSACSYAANSIRIYPIMISIVLHNYKILKEKNFVLFLLISMMLILIRPIVMVIIMPILIIVIL